MNKNKKSISQEIFVIAILMFTATILWAYLSVYRAFKKSEKPLLTAKETQLLSPKLDALVFEELKKRKTK